MDCILLFNNPDKTLAMIYICNNYLIEQNVIKHIQTHVFVLSFKGCIIQSTTYFCRLTVLVPDTVY